MKELRYSLTSEAMMFKLLLKRCLLLLLLLIITGQAEAQPPFTGQLAPQPVISPYLGLSGGGLGNFDNSNYFTIVLPQIRAQQELQRQQGQISQLQRTQQRQTPFAGNRAGSPIQSPQIRNTGHTTFFNNYSHYYNLTPGRRQ
jgi:hypothetical protein